MENVKVAESRTSGQGLGDHDRTRLRDDSDFGSSIPRSTWVVELHVDSRFQNVNPLLISKDIINTRNSS